VILYLDASALVKRYVREPGSDAVRRMTDSADRWFMSRVGYVEAVGAIARRAGPADVTKFRADWPWVQVIEVRQSLAELAGRLAVADRLNALDAIHLASALALVDDKFRFATWDRRLHAAARNRGLAVLPETLG
jgi:predicted nucleic acid-binding protein